MGQTPKCEMYNYDTVWKSVGENLWNLELDKEPLGSTPKAQPMKGKFDIMDLIKIRKKLPCERPCLKGGEDMWFANIFYSLPFHFLNSTFSKTKIFNLDNVKFTNFLKCLIVPALFVEKIIHFFIALPFHLCEISFGYMSMGLYMDSILFSGFCVCSFSNTTLF